MTSAHKRASIYVGLTASPLIREPAPPKPVSFVELHAQYLILSTAASAIEQQELQLPDFHYVTTDEQEQITTARDLSKARLTEIQDKMRKIEDIALSAPCP